MTEVEDKLQTALKEFLELFDLKFEPTESSSPAGKDYSEMIQATREKLDDCNIQAEEILQKTGKTREELDAYSNNPNNFTPEQWAALQRLKEATEEVKRKAFQAVNPEKLKINKKIEKEKGKQTHRFGKKKDWIQM